MKAAWISPRRLARIVLVLALVGTFMALNVRVRAQPPPSSAWSAALQLRALEGGTWESEPLRANVTVAGLGWEGNPPQAAWVRGSTDGESWTEWIELGLDIDHGPDPGTAELSAARSVSEPVYLGPVAHVQYRVEDFAPQLLSAELVETAGRQLGLVERLGLFIESLEWGRSNEAGAVPDQPSFITRDQWGGDQCLGPDSHEPAYTPRVQTMFVHHTSGSSAANSYSESEALDYVYGICSYHVNANGWHDIGYNFLIDRFGNIYEGRAGGVDRAVYGAHTGGFNYYSTGVAFLGFHTYIPPTQDAQDALVELAAWKLNVHHVDPLGSVTVESMGSSRYAAGIGVALPRVAGHRDASATACPGSACYGLLGGFRTQIDQTGGTKIYGGWPTVDPVPGTPLTGYGSVRFPLRFSQPTAWVFEIRDKDGRLLHHASGQSSSIEIDWDATIDGAPAPMAEYFATVTGTSQSGDPTPVSDSFRLGEFIPPFRDDEGNSHEENIIMIAEAGYTTGCDFELYCPHAPVSRAQMATFLARALDLPASTDDWFSDDSGTGHEDNINRLAAAGVSTGCAPGIYCPDEPITRAQMAAMIARALDLGPGGEDAFDDDDGSMFEGDINALATAGITQGCAPGMFCPAGLVTRAQMASFLARAFLDGL